tara:strand:- start:2370 stop:2879 length:510 start_codon:yes stop_codon:yes gene_type:complete
MKLILVFLLIPTLSLCESFPIFNSLKYDEVNLRHYPEKDDPYLKTIKFVLTEKGMPVKVTRDYNAGGNIVEWYQVELFNGITGWIYHTQLSQKRRLLLRENTNLYLFNSYKKGSLRTKIKAKIISPQIITLIEIKGKMAKVEFSHNDKFKTGWIILEDSIWGLLDKERN